MQSKRGRWYLPLLLHMNKECGIRKSFLFVKSREIIQLTCVYDTKCILRVVNVTEKLLQPFLHPQLCRFPPTHVIPSTPRAVFFLLLVGCLVLCSRNCFFIGTRTMMMLLLSYYYLPVDIIILAQTLLSPTTLPLLS